MTDDISSAPPQYGPPSIHEAKFSQPLQQPQYLLSPSLQKYGFSPSTQSPEPIVVPIMMPQSYPCQQQVSDKPVNIVVNANSKAEDSCARDCRICSFCKRGIMKKKRDWLRVIAILLISMLCPPLSFLCCFFLCTSVVYFGKCSVCQRISKKRGSDDIDNRIIFHHLNKNLDNVVTCLTELLAGRSEQVQRD